MSTLYQIGEVSTLSTEYVEVAVSAWDRGRRVSMAGTGVQFAFVPEEVKPGVGDWNTGSWEVINRTWIARCLVGTGPDAVAVPAGTWVVWVRIVANPETPTRAVGLLVVA